MTKLKKNRVTIIGGLLVVVAILLLFSLIQCRHSKMSLTSIFCDSEKSAFQCLATSPNWLKQQLYLKLKGKNLNFIPIESVASAQ